MKRIESQVERLAVAIRRQVPVGVFLISTIGALLSLTQGEAVEPQHSISRVQLMPRVPEPLVVRNWSQLARQYYELILNPATRLDGEPLVVIRTDPPTFDMPSWVGGNPKDEAFTCLSAVIGARLVGLDPRNQHGVDYVRRAKSWFDASNGVYRHSRGQRGQDIYHAGIYGYWAGVQGLMLASQYPDDPDFQSQTRASCQSFLRIAKGVGCPHEPNFDVLGFNFRTGVPDGRREPMNRLGHAPAVAWPLLVGFHLTNDREMLDCAQTAMQWHIDHPGRYEITHMMGPLTAARLNAQHGCRLDMDRVLATWFGDGDRQRMPWKVTAGTRFGNVTCDGLDGAVRGDSERGFHAFAMGSLQGPAWLVPVVRYDPRYARDIGRYALHAATSARLLQGVGLNWNHQDHKDWKDRWDPQGLLFYEALTSWDWGSEHRFRPYATGDAIRLGWGVPKTSAEQYHVEKQRWFSKTSNNLALYMGNHVGFLGGIVAATDALGVLRWDCLATDWFHAPAYPTHLYYNPHTAPRTISLELARPADLYDLVQGKFVARRAKSDYDFTLGADQAAVLVQVPPGAQIQVQRDGLVADGIVIDYRRK